MDDIRKFKERAINTFIYENINLNHSKASDIKQGLTRLLGEEPGVKYVYKENMKINETTGDVERLANELEKIEIIYTYPGMNEKGEEIPYAARMTYIVN